MMEKLFLGMAIVGLCVVTAGSALAATVPGVTIEDYSSQLGETFNRQARFTVDGSGLSGGQHGVAPDGYMWLTKGTYQDPNDPLPAHITFDLEANYDLNSVHVWNYNEATSGLSTRGAKNVEISVASSVGGGFTSLGGFTFTKATGQADYTGEDIDLSTFGAANNARLVRFDISTNHGGAQDFVGLSEVQFDANFTPPTPITVPNFSFEDGLNNWTKDGGGGTYGGGSGELPPDHGSLYAYLETATAQPGTVTLTSAASLETVSAGWRYTLTAAVGHRNFAEAGGRRPDDYLIELLVDGAPVASNTLADGYANIPAAEFVDLSTAFTAGASGGDLTIRLTHSSDDPTFRQGAYDNIRLTALVPEPATLALAAVGLGGLRRRRRA